MRLEFEGCSCFGAVLIWVGLEMVCVLVAYVFDDGKFREVGPKPT